jgi:hypothetical protein
MQSAALKAVTQVFEEALLNSGCAGADHLYRYRVAVLGLKQILFCVCPGLAGGFKADLGDRDMKERGASPTIQKPLNLYYIMRRRASPKAELSMVIWLCGICIVKSVRSFFRGSALRCTLTSPDLVLGDLYLI